MPMGDRETDTRQMFIHAETEMFPTYSVPRGEPLGAGKDGLEEISAFEESEIA